MSLQQFERKSLQEINQSIDVPKGIPFWKTLLLFSGPGSLVAVGYMDPGNWITSVVGGAQYRYLLLSVVLLSSLISMQLQQMAGKLGIVHRKDLAQTTTLVIRSLMGIELCNIHPINQNLTLVIGVHPS